MTDHPENNQDNFSQPTPVLPPANKRQWTIGLVVLVIVGLSATLLLIRYIFANKNNALPVPTTISPTPQVIPTSNNVSLKPTLPPNPHGNTYRSDTLHLAFYYAATVNGSNETFTVSEAGNKVYIYATGQTKESGQSVESFTKDPNLTLEQAITQQFLTGIDTDTCFVNPLDSTQVGIEKAIIDYPVPTDAPEPFFMYGEACPANYSKTNGIRYFYYDPQFPDRYFFFNIGQYGIPAYNDTADENWQDTFRIIP